MLKNIFFLFLLNLLFSCSSVDTTARHLKKNDFLFQSLENKKFLIQNYPNIKIEINDKLVKINLQKIELGACCTSESISINKNEFFDILKAAHYAPGDVTERVKSRIHFFKKLNPDDEYAMKIASEKVTKTIKAIYKGKKAHLDYNSAHKFNLVVDNFFNDIMKKKQFSFEINKSEESIYLYNLIMSFYYPVFDSFEFVNIKPGQFEMGSPPNEKFRNSDEVLHNVHISNGFEIARTAVTQAQYYLVMGYNPSSFSRRDYCPNDYVRIFETEICPSLPVENVSWNDAQIFIKRINLFDKSYIWSLPTEAEREYFTRAGSATRYHFGDDDKHLHEFGFWFANSNSQPQAVGQLKCNSWNICDVHGNIWEYTQDIYAANYLDNNNAQTDPSGAEKGFSRVMRGGSWGSAGVAALRSARRNFAPPDYRAYMIGFRVKRVKK